jgi:V/A-type H+-transporting ATPase subunit D
MKLRDELQFAQLGYDLLDQKRNILVIELLNLVDQTVELQSRVDEALRKAYRTLEDAVLSMGRVRVQYIANAVNIETSINISSRRVMGVSLPVVTTDFKEHAPFYSPMGSSFWIDSSLNEFKAVLELLGRFAELKVSVFRLAAEVKKTIRKVNALEKIAIPDLKETVSYIENSLEEYERDMFTIMRMVKARLEKKKSETRSEEIG